MRNRFGRGYVDRDYQSFPEFSAYKEYSGGRIPSSQWAERIDHLNSIGGQPYHWHQSVGRKAVYNQKSTPYCWMYGVCGAINNSLIRQGVGHVDLNPFATAYLGKKGRFRGGFGIEACRYIQQWGVPEKDDIPEFQRSFRWSEAAKQSARKHRLVSFEELPKNSMESVIDAILVERCPVSVAFSWWKHLVCCLGVAKRGNEFGLICLNSWGPNWGDNGYTTLWGNKAIPFEAVAVRHVRSRDESDD